MIAAPSWQKPYSSVLARLKPGSYLQVWKNIELAAVQDVSPDRLAERIENMIVPG
jgi:hypothetical protein